MSVVEFLRTTVAAHKQMTKFHNPHLLRFGARNAVETTLASLQAAAPTRSRGLDSHAVVIDPR
jgi:hypothetical protein